MDPTLRALLRANFDWTTHIDAIWESFDTDVTELQSEARAELELNLDDLAEERSKHSPLGVPLVGMAGSGKTHLLGALRKSALKRGMWFVLVDMTDVSDFWETVLLGYLRSLQQRGTDPGQRQIDTWLSRFVTRYGERKQRSRPIPSQRPPGLINTCNALIAALGKDHSEAAREHADVLRALILFACDHAEINDLGYKWLQGIGIDEDERHHHGFRETQRSPVSIVRGLSWLLSLQSPTVLALDQLDAIVAEHNLAGETDDIEPSEQQRASLAIIQGIAGGLMALRDVTRSTLCVVSALGATWPVLEQRSVASMVDRYHEPLRLDAGTSEASIRQLVMKRLGQAYSAAGLAVPYPSYPYTDAFFSKHQRNTPREVLKACDAHRRACRRSGSIHETDAVVAPTSSRGLGSVAGIGEQVDGLAQAARIDEMLGDKTERKLDVLIETACVAILREQRLPDSALARVDKDFVGTGAYDPLHARIRLILTEQNERERHHSFRFLQQQNPRAFQARLKAAITASGIDHALTFRRLTILRIGAPPGGDATRKLLDELAARGGGLIEPSEAELRVLHALSQLIDATEEPPGLDEWLRLEQPVSKLPSFRQAAAWLFADLESAARSKPTSVREMATPGTTSTSGANATPRVAGNAAAGARAGTGNMSEIPLGRTPDEVVTVDLGSLANHTCVLAGSGSGKTVFLRRIVEEAALAGVPSIVLDGANDLARLGERWPTRPGVFSDEDAEKASRYHERTEVVVWTPGITSGNPVCLDPIPDFSSLTDDSDETIDQFNGAVSMAESNLGPLVASGRSAKAKRMRAILTAALQRFGKRGGGKLGELITLLRDPPDDVVDGYANGEKMAQEISELLLAAAKTDPLLGGTGTVLDPAQLLRASSPDKVRVSVVNLAGLQGLDAQRQFVSQLGMALFTYVKKHPASPGALLGLFVVDEAKDFVPATSSVPGKDNLIRLVAQARKYGLGMLFASQAPKSIDHNIVANCSTLLIGKANSPTAIATVQQLLQNKGGSAATGKDVGKLPTGTFYASTPKMPKPRKVTSSLCLSYHPSSPPSETEVVELARRSRATFRAT